MNHFYVCKEYSAEFPLVFHIASLMAWDGAAFLCVLCSVCGLLLYYCLQHLLHEETSRVAYGVHPLCCEVDLGTTL